MKKTCLLFVLFISFAMTSTYELIISLDDYNGLRLGSKVVYNQENIGKEGQTALTGWGGGAWNEAGTTWNNSGSTSFGIRLWHQQNFGDFHLL